MDIFISRCNVDRLGALTLLEKMKKKICFLKLEQVDFKITVLTTAWIFERYYICKCESFLNFSLASWTPESLESDSAKRPLQLPTSSNVIRSSFKGPKRLRFYVTVYKTLQKGFCHFRVKEYLSKYVREDRALSVKSFI